jgi:TP901 family phage tail tape measure protein
MATDYQKTLRETSSNLDLNATQTKELDKAIKSVMMNSASPMEDIAEAYRTAGSEGYKVSEATKIINEANKAAIVTGDKVSNVTNAVTVAMHDYRASAEDATKYLGYMHGAMVAGNMKMEELSPNIGILANTTSLAGVSFRETMGAMAMMTSSGMSAAEATTSINNALMHLEVPTKGARKAMEELHQTTGIDIYNDFQKVKAGSMSLSDALGDVRKATGGNVDSMHAILPEVRGLRVLMADAGSQGKVFAESLKAVDNGTNALKESYEANSDNLDLLTKQMKNQFQVALIEVGTALLPIVIKAVKSATEFFQAHREQIIKVAQALTDNLSGAIKATIQFFRDHKEEIDRAKNAIKEFITQAWTKLVEGFNYFKDDILPKIIEGWKNLKKGFDDFSTWYKNNKNWIENLGLVFAGFAIGIGLVYGAVAIFNGVLAIATGVATAFGVVMAVVTSPIFLIGLAIGAVIAAGLLLWKNWDFIKQKAVEFMFTLVNLGNQIRDGMTRSVMDAINFLSRINLWDIGSNIMNGLINGIKDKVREVENTVRRVANSVSDTIRNALGIRSPSRVMMELGMYTTQGLQKGMEQGQPNVTQSAQNLSKAVIQGYTTNSNSNTNQSVTNNNRGGDLHLNFPNQPILLNAQSLAEFFKQSKSIARQQGFSIA